MSVRSKSKVLVTKRVFLNDDKSMSGIGCLHMVKDSGVDEQDGKKKTFVSVWGTLQLSDCNRLISLDLDSYSRVEATKSLNKLKRIKDLVDTAIKVLEENKNSITR